MEQGRKRLFISSFKAVLFGSLLAGIIALFSDYVPKNHSEKMEISESHLLKTMDSVNYDIFFFTNSTIYTSIDLLYLEHLTGLKGLMFCGPAQCNMFTLKTIEHVLKICRPKCIVIDLSRVDTFLPVERKGWSFNIESLLSSDVSLTYMIKHIKEIPKKERLNFLLDGYSEYTATLGNMNRWREYKKPKPDQHIEYYLGFVPLKKPGDKITRMTREDFDKVYHNSKAKDSLFFDRPSREAFFSFFRDFSKTGIKVIFISSIKLDSKTEAGFKSLSDTIKQLSPGNYFTVNLNDIKVKDTLKLGKEDFSDNSHPDYRGAIKITNYLAPVFSSVVSPSGAGQVYSPVIFKDPEFGISDYKIILDDYFMKTIQLYFDRIPGNYRDSSLVIRVVPEDQYFEKMSENMKQKHLKLNLEYLTRDRFVKTHEGNYVASVFLQTRCPKDEIKYIEISLTGEDQVAIDSVALYRKKN
jgi:hypothetical protein